MRSPGLHVDHRALGGALAAQHPQLCADVVAIVAGVDGPRLDRWYRVAEVIAEHLATEDNLMLPEFARQAPAEARELRALHQRLRDAMRAATERIVGGDAPALALLALAAELRALAEREEASLYPWARGDAPP